MTSSEREDMRRFLETLESDLEVETTDDSRDQLRAYLNALDDKQERVNAAVKKFEQDDTHVDIYALRGKVLFCYAAAVGAALMWAVLIKLLSGKQ